jgi:hypothetical protein
VIENRQNFPGPADQILISGIANQNWHFPVEEMIHEKGA